MDRLCEYGCGKEAKFPPGKGRKKWCCSKSPNSCPEIRRRNGEVKKGKNNPMYGKESWNKGKTGVYSKETLEKKSKAIKSTIKQIKEKYKTFSKIEEMRYNPDNPEEKEIQVHCKNHLCPNSKEKGGWFTPTSDQIYHRSIAIEKPKGFGESNFYCSQYCKDSCPCYRLRSDPFQLAEFEQYNREVWKYTNSNLKYNSNKIPDIELRGNNYGYDLDHKFSIFDGFNNNIDPSLIGHWKNLEIIKTSDNRTKAGKSSISIEEIGKMSL